MAGISKHVFESACENIPCSDSLHHWHESCVYSSIQTYKDSVIGSARFYAVVYMIQLGMHLKKLHRKKTWIQLAKNYVGSTILGAGVAGSVITLSCIIRNLKGGKTNYYTFLYIPFIINGLFIYCEPPGRRGLVINLFVNLLIEYYLRVLSSAGRLNITKTKQTLLFMIGSSFLFYLMRLEGDKKHRTPLFWVFTPEKVRQKSDVSENVCPHEGKCFKYILKGFSTYFGIGLAITLARKVLPKMRTPIKALSSIRGKHFKMALFFSSYIGIYRAVICYLCRKKGYDSALYALPAGYLAGLSIMFNPSLGLSIAALTGALKLFSTILYEKKILPSNIPLPELLYCFCQGTLFNARYMNFENCPGYIIHLMKTVTNGFSEGIYERLIENIKKAS